MAVATKMNNKQSASISIKNPKNYIKRPRAQQINDIS
jgi:hypothetical protein